MATPCRLVQGPQAVNGVDGCMEGKAAVTDLLRHIMRAGEAGRCGAGGVFVLDLFEDFKFATTSFLDEVGTVFGGCAGVVDTAPLPPSDNSVPCLLLLFFLVMLRSQ